MPITHISGPFCENLIESYIAHETDSPETAIPIITESGYNILPENALVYGGSVDCDDGEEICCNVPTIIQFVNQIKTEIDYGPVLRAKHGSEPLIQVYYFVPGEEDGEFIMSVFTKKQMIGIPLNKIIVDHGGMSTGLIKLL